MKTFFVWLLLAFYPSITVIASDHSVIQSLIDDLNQNAETLILRLKASGYEENSDKTFQEANVRVFIKAANGIRPLSYILEQCGNQFTGYTREITSMESLLLMNELKREGYKKVEKGNGKYRKSNITVDFYDDDSQLLLATHYIRVSRKNSCHYDDLVSPLVPAFNFRPSTLEVALSNLKRNRTEMTLAAAQIAFTPSAEKDADGQVCYKKANQTFTIKYCNNKVQRFEVELNAVEWNSLVTSIEKSIFRKIKDDVAANNYYSRTYENEVYEVKVYYYGDKYGREFNENAFKIELLDKRGCK